MKKKAKKEKHDIWLKIVLKVLEFGKASIPSPFAEDGIIKSVFFGYDNETDLTQGIIWCTVTNEAVHIGKLHIPDHVQRFHEEERAEVFGNMPPIRIIMMIN